MSATLHQWLAEGLDGDVSEVVGRLRAVPEIGHIAIMPDVHIAGEFCVGTVVASSGTLFPGAVGGDIGCGMCALAFDADAAVLEDRQAAAEVLAMLYEVVPAKRHHRALAPAFPQRLLELPLSGQVEFLKKAGGDGHLQLGTLGGGNHFLELQADVATGRLWLMLHSGSRNAGQVVYHHHLPAARRIGGGVMAMAADSAAGEAYLRDMAWARAYARANRAALAQAVGRGLEQTLGVIPLVETMFDADHNHVQRETHFGSAWFVHRKGAQAAGVDEAGMIPGSMATASVHTAGRGCAESLRSSSHGAGRAMSRNQAREAITVGVLKQQLKGVWYDHRNAYALREEGPGAYRDIHAVVRAQEELTRVVRTLRPVLSYKSP